MVTIGYAEERLQLLNANHRDLAKFESPSDSNYRSLRNRLASTVQQIRQEIQESQISLPPPDLTLSELPNLLNLPNLPDLYQSTANEMEEIARYLSVDQSAEDNLSSLNDTRLNGSCSWLTAKPSFQEWWSSLAPRYFWLKGAPASGKSVLASYIIEYLKENPTCYYFFRKGDKTGNNLSSFLRSMAFQMAQTNPAIRSALFQLSQQGPPIDIRNQRSIWNKVYTSCVFHITLNKPYVFTRLFKIYRLQSRPTGIIGLSMPWTRQLRKDRWMSTSSFYQKSTTTFLSRSSSQANLVTHWTICSYNFH